jgi:hypothetical protein
VETMTQEKLVQAGQEDVQTNQERRRTERFLVDLDRHHGYFLFTEDDITNGIRVEFDSDDIFQQFQSFVSQSSLRSNVGKRLFCDCVGEYYERYGTLYFRVREAHLFAK